MRKLRISARVAALVALLVAGLAAGGAAIVVAPLVVRVTGVAKSKPGTFVVARPTPVSDPCWLSGETAQGEVTIHRLNCQYGGVFAFSKQRAAVWSPVAPSPMDVNLGVSPKKVALNVHFFGPTARNNSARKRIKTWVATANQLLGATNPMGLTFVNPSTHVHKTVTEAERSNSVGQGCASDRRGKNATDEKAAYTSSTLTVYVVPVVIDSDGIAITGEACGTPINLIYISLDFASRNTLAHEIGHALDLEHPEVENEAWAEAHLNLMIDGHSVEFEDMEDYDSLTAGQAVQGVFGTASWLNKVAAGIKPPLPNAAKCSPDRCPGYTLAWK